MEKSKYSNEGVTVMKSTDADTVLVIVINGNRGNGFTMLSKDPDVNRTVPAILRNTADLIERGE